MGKFWNCMPSFCSIMPLLKTFSGASYVLWQRTVTHNLQEILAPGTCVTWYSWRCSFLKTFSNILRFQGVNLAQPKMDSNCKLWYVPFLLKQNFGRLFINNFFVFLYQRLPLIKISAKQGHIWGREGQETLQKRSQFTNAASNTKGIENL